jgi:hypothetical protein
MSPNRSCKVKSITDYTYCDSWHLKHLGFKPGDQFAVATDIGELKAGDLVRLVGFDDVDNHFGIFVFTKSTNEVLEVRGDFSSPDGSSLSGLKKALSRTE